MQFNSGTENLCISIQRLDYEVKIAGVMVA